MARERVLVTGGAGFIGRHVTSALLARGYDVVVLDALIEQVHGNSAGSVALSPDVKLVKGDVRDGKAVRRALEGTDAVIHLAAEVGVGQSMYSVERFVSVNDCGTAVLFDALASRPVRRIVVASSMSVYGEGLYVSDTRAISRALELPQPLPWRQGLVRLAEWLRERRTTSTATRPHLTERVP